MPRSFLSCLANEDGVSVGDFTWLAKVRENNLVSRCYSTGPPSSKFWPPINVFSTGKVAEGGGKSCSTCIIHKEIFHARGTLYMLPFTSFYSTITARNDQLSSPAILQYRQKQGAAHRQQVSRNIRANSNFLAPCGTRLASGIYQAPRSRILLRPRRRRPRPPPTRPRTDSLWDSDRHRRQVWAGADGRCRRIDASIR